MGWKVCHAAPDGNLNWVVPDPGWTNSHILHRLDPSEINAIKRRPGKDIMLFGSGTIVSQLTEHGLIDEYQLLVCPVLLGSGKKLFADGSASHSFKLARSCVSPNGLIVGHYVREGEIKIGDTTLDSSSEREIARRKRMKREG